MVLGAIFAGLLVYSQTFAFCWDEGFHLLAARMISFGKRPYLDFCFPQTPLNAYLNASLVRVFGNTWKPAHVLAAVWLSGGVFLIADFVFSRFPVGRWRLAASLFAAILIVSVYNVVGFGTVAQAYAICLFLTVAAMRVACAAVRRGSLALIFCAGLLACASAACSMLTAAAVPVLLVWCVIQNRGARRKTAAVFIAAAVIPFLPVVWLFAHGPAQTFFNIVQYQALYRGVNWGEATPHDVEVFFDLSESPAGLMLVLLGASALVYARRNAWDRRLVAEYFLCAAIAAGIALELLTAHPTFARYFLLTVPFLAVPAAGGLMIVGSKLYRADRPWPAFALAALLTLYGLAGQGFEDRDSLHWRQMEKVAAKVNEVTPPGATLGADEITYFLTGRPAPPGMEFAYGQKLNLPADRERLMHLIPQSKVDEMLRNKIFQTFEVCEEDDMDLKPAQFYNQHAEVETCHVYWDPKEGQWESR